MAMHTWFECKIRYEKTMENGMNKKVTEPYLVDALSFTEAEARIIEEMTPFISGEFTVSDIKRANYSELFPSEEEAADRWFNNGKWNEQEGDRTVPGGCPQFYGSGSTHHRRDDAVHFGRVHRIGHQTCQL